MTMKKTLALLLTLSLVAMSGCSNSGTEPQESSDISAENTEAEPYEYSIADLDGLISGIGDAAILQNSEGVDLLGLVTYDDTIVKEVSLDPADLDCTTVSEVSVTYMITVDAAALAEHLNLTPASDEDETEAETSAEDSQELSFSVTVTVYVISETEVSDFQTNHPDVPIYTTNMELYAPAEIPQAEITKAPEASVDANKTEHAQSAENTSTENTSSKSEAGTSDKPSGPVNSDSGSNSGSGTSAGSGASNSGSGTSETEKPTGTASGSGSGNGSSSGSSGGNSGSNPGTSTGNSGSGSNTGTSSGSGSASSGANSGSASSGNTESGNGSGSKVPSADPTSKPAHTHSYTAAVTKAATCGSAGIRTYTCSCGDSYTETIPATGNHSWIELTSTVHHDEVGHYETKTISEARDVPIQEGKQVCNACGAYFDSAAEVWDHILFEHDGNSSYSVKLIVTGYTHYDAVTEDVWVVDQAAYDETVVTGYKCSVCGATK